jgi:polyhydroxybutyrate depolymerase
MKNIIPIIISAIILTNAFGVVALPVNEGKNIVTKPSSIPGNHFCFMIHGLRIRSYRVHVPPSYDGETEVPLVILLHGGGLSSSTISKRSDMDEKSDEEGFIAVYPNGTEGFLISFLHRLILKENRGLQWNMHGVVINRPYLLRIDDVGFINAIIETMKEEYSINSSRIYLGGFSQGAILSYYAGSILSDKIAAIGPLAGTIGVKRLVFSRKVPKPENPLPVIIFHGLKDKDVPYDDADPVWKAFSVNESVDFWVKHNNCNQTPTITESGNITIRTYSNGTDDSEVVLYTVNNGEHWWFGGSWDGDKYYDPYQEISATDLMWDFFERHPKK